MSRLGCRLGASAYRRYTFKHLRPRGRVILLGEISETMVVDPRHISHQIHVYRLLGPKYNRETELDELLDLPFVFGGVMDTYTDCRGFIVGFNSGVMAFRPDSNVPRHAIESPGGAKKRRTGFLKPLLRSTSPSSSARL